MLQIRLPSGESLRVCFPADARLRDVVDHVTSLHPSLPTFTLFHGFPRRRFSDSDLSLSLHSLGLTPNAALVLQAITPPDPSIPSAIHDPEPPRSDPPVQQGAVELPQPVAPPQFQPPRWEDMVHAGIAEPRHRWGTNTHTHTEHSFPRLKAYAVYEMHTHSRFLSDAATSNWAA